jgi:hypothetical protein
MIGESELSRIASRPGPAQFRKTDLWLSRVCDLDSEMSLDFEELLRIDSGLAEKARGK